MSDQIETGVNLGKDVEKSSEKSKWKMLNTYSYWKLFERLLLVFVIIIIILVAVAFTIPTIFYFLPPTQEQGSGILTNSPDVCLEPAVYTGATCRAELQIYQECFSGSAGSNGDIFIHSDIDQETVEGDAALLIEGGLSFLNPSAECLAAIRPFLCLYLFGVCDSGNQLRQVSSSECVDLRDNICIREWSAAIGFLGAGTLPVCEELSGETGSCVDPLEFNETEISSGAAGSIELNSSITCSEGFYLSNAGTCRPQCGVWKQQSDENVLKEAVVTIIACCTAIVSAVAVFILAFTIQRHFLLTFPSFYLVYLCISGPVFCAVVLIGYFDNAALFCSSMDLLSAIDNPTHLCNITGFLSNYALLQTTLFGFFHSASLFWGIRFPFHYRNFKESGYIKYIHITTVVVAVFVPFVPGLAHLKDGFVPGRIPTSTCVGRNPVVTYSTLVVPVSILIAISVSLLIIIYWTILKEFVIKKIARGKQGSRVTKAQLKIMFILWYYIILGTLGLVTFTYFTTTRESSINQLQMLFLCESFGVQANRDCDEILRSVTLQTVSNLALVGIVLLGLLPVVVLVFTFDLKVFTCKKKKKTSSN